MASNNCHPYRRSTTNSIYNIIPSQAQRCSAKAAGCRQYRGPTAGNTRLALAIDFEQGSQAAGWQSADGISLTTESLEVGGHSLMVGGNNNTVTLNRTAAVPVRPGHQYILTAWVKGTDRIITNQYMQNNGSMDNPQSTSFNSLKSKVVDLLSQIKLVNAQNLDAHILFNVASTTGNDWSLIKVGPILADNVEAENLTFSLQLTLDSGLNSVYIDNISLKEITSDVYVIENTWTTPRSCDNPPGLPQGDGTNDRTQTGAMIGCQEYQNGTQKINLRSFTHLCEQGAVGCQAFIKTNNSKSPFAQIYNQTCTINHTAVSPETCVVEGSAGRNSCIVAAGKHDCRYSVTGMYGEDFADTVLTDDQVSVPADSVEYIVDDPKTYCRSDAVGCTEIGQPKINRQTNQVVDWQSVYQVVNPDQFNQSLCTSDQLWCSNFNLTKGGTITFKDPALNSSGDTDRTCDYREGVQVTSGTESKIQSGWFKTGTSQSCSADGLFNLSNNGGYVGICPSKYDGCTDFVDPATNVTGGLKDNYFIKNSVDDSSCNGRIDVQAGCMLFNDTSQPAVYNALQSYPPLRATGQAPVSTNNNNANVIIKVNRDRQCNKWYYCNNNITVTDKSGNIQQLCSNLTTCSKLDPVTKKCLNPGVGVNAGSAFSNTQEFTFVSPQDDAKWKNLSGYAITGLQLNDASSTLISRGYSPLNLMTQEGSPITLVNGGFNDQTDQLSALAANDGEGWYNCSYYSTSLSGWVSSTSVCSYVVEEGKVIEGVSALRLAPELNKPTRLWHANTSVSGNNEYILSAYVNTNDLQGDEKAPLPARTTATALHFLVIQRDANNNFVCDGPCPADGAVEVLAVPRGKDWHLASAIINTRATTKKIQIGLVLHSEAHGNVFVDDINLAPFLKLNQAVYAGQQCRIYPRADAPSCVYDQPEGTYRGIKGYCLKRDPRDNGRCLQWWPIDMVIGQGFDLFSQNNITLIPNEQSLRYCIEAKGNGPYFSDYIVNDHIRAGDRSEFMTSAASVGSTNANSFPWNLNASEIANIRVHNTGNSMYPGDFVINVSNNFTTLPDFVASNGQHYNYGVEHLSGGEMYVNVYVYFDQTTGRFIGSKIDTDTSAGCGDGDCGVGIEARLTLKEECAVVAEVSKGQQYAARFNVFNNKLPVPVAPNTIMNSAAADVSPYGAMSRDYSDLATEPCGPDDVPGKVGCLVPIGLFGDASKVRGGQPLACPIGSNGASKCGYSTFTIVGHCSDSGLSCTYDEACRPGRCQYDSLTGLQNCTNNGNSCSVDSDCWLSPNPVCNTTTTVAATHSMQCSIDSSNNCLTTAEQNACFAPPNSTNHGVCLGYTGDSALLNGAAAGNRVQGALNLSNLFAKSYQTWTMDPSTGTYVTNDCLSQEIQNRIAASANGVDSNTGCWDRRRILSNSDDRPAVNDILLNGENVPDITINNGQTIELKFSTLVSLDHKPLQYICVDWGDGFDENTDCTGPLSIDHQTNVANAAPMYHQYDAANVTTPCTGGGTDKCARIRIQIKDNWGWCNGSGSGSNDPAPQGVLSCGGPAANPSDWTDPRTVRISGGSNQYNVQGNTMTTANNL